jgi:hypothetical protein
MDRPLLKKITPPLWLTLVSPTGIHSQGTRVCFIQAQLGTAKMSLALKKQIGMAMGPDPTMIRQTGVEVHYAEKRMKVLYDK